MFGRVALLCGLVLSLPGCFRQQIPPDDVPPSPATSAVTLQPESSAWILVLQGYENAALRRDFQSYLQSQGLEVELLNAGASHAEYQVLLTSSVNPDWRQNAAQFLGQRYVLKQEAERLLFIRQ